MRSRLFLSAFFLALLSLSCHGQEQRYYLTEAEYTQIVQNMMTAQKSLLECQSELSEAQADLQTLREQLRTQSESLMRSRKEQAARLLVCGALCFSAGAVGTLLVAAASR